MADNGPTLNAALVTVIFDRIRTIIAMKSYIFVIFQLEGGGMVVRTHCPLPLDPRMEYQLSCKLRWQKLQQMDEFTGDSESITYMRDFFIIIVTCVG